MRAPARMPPRKCSAAGASRRGGATKQPHGPSLRSASHRGRKHHALRKRGRAQRWPVWLFWLLGSAPSGCAWGAQGAGRRVCRRTHPLRGQACRSCLSGAPQARSEFHGAPRKCSAAGCPCAPRGGRSQQGRLLFGDFLLAKQEKVTAPPGAYPGLHPQPKQEVQIPIPPHPTESKLKQLESDPNYSATHGAPSSAATRLRRSDK